MAATLIPAAVEAARWQSMSPQPSRRSPRWDAGGGGGGGGNGNGNGSYRLESPNSVGEDGGSRGSLSASAELEARWLLSGGSGGGGGGELAERRTLAGGGGELAGRGGLAGSGGLQPRRASTVPAVAARPSMSVLPSVLPAAAADCLAAIDAQIAALQAVGRLSVPEVLTKC